MSRTTVNGVEVVRSGEMSNADVDKRREIQKKRIERMAEYFDDQEMDWSDVDVTENMSDREYQDLKQGHVDDAYDKARKADWK